MCVACNENVPHAQLTISRYCAATTNHKQLICESSSLFNPILPCINLYSKMLMQILVHGCVWFDDETKKHLFSLCTLENGRVVKKKRTWKSWEHQSGKWRQVDMWWRERGWKQARTAGPLCPPHIHLTPFLWSMISRFPWILLHFCILGRPVNSSRLWATF